MSRNKSDLHRYSPTQQRLRRRLRAESLESRWCPAVTFGLAGGVLTVSGDGADDQIQLIDRGDGQVDLILGDTTESFAEVNQIVVNSGDGNDQIEVALSPSDSAITAMSALQIDSGSGDDVVTVTGPALQRGEQRGDILNVALDYQIDVGTGEDVLTVGIRQYDAVDLGIAAADGNDSVTVGLLLPAVQKVRSAAAAIDVMVEGSGNTVNVASRNFDDVAANVVAAAGAGAVTADSQNEVNLSFLRVDPSDPSTTAIDDQLTLVVELGSTNDTLVVSSFGFHHLTSSLNAGGGENNGHVLHRVAGGSANTAAVDAVFGDENDVVSMTLMGYDEVAANLSSGDGDDTIAALFQRNGRAGTGQLNLTVDAGAGDDRLVASALGLHAVVMNATAGAGHDDVTLSVLESFRRGRNLRDSSTLQVTVDLGAGDDHLRLLSRGFAQIDTRTDTGPGGDGTDTLSAIHLAAVGGFFNFPRLRRSLTQLDDGADTSGIVTLGYATVDIQSDVTVQTAVIRD